LIYVSNRTRKHRLNTRALARTARDLLQAAGVGSATLSLSFVGDRAIRTLNLAHRGFDRPTDVLSFPLYETASVPLGRPRGAEPERLLGDVVISLDAAQRQARAYDATLRAEVERLLIHGILHLLGHDHEEAGERARMVRAERRLAKAIGLTWPYSPELGR
jgi:probable rRNA maturation factor